jgi:hypothetical protein
MFPFKFYFFWALENLKIYFYIFRAIYLKPIHDAGSEYDWPYMAFICVCGTLQQMTISFATELFH